MRSVEEAQNFIMLLFAEWMRQGQDLRFGQFLFNNGIVDMDQQCYHMECSDFLEKFPEIPKREYTYWGTYGKTGKDPVKKVLVKDLAIDHIEAILETQKHISDKFRNLLQEELAFRNK